MRVSALFISYVVASTLAIAGGHSRAIAQEQIVDCSQTIETPACQERLKKLFGKFEEFGRLIKEKNCHQAIRTGREFVQMNFDKLAIDGSDLSWFPAPVWNLIGQCHQGFANNASLSIPERNSELDKAVAAQRQAWELGENTKLKVPILIDLGSALAMYRGPGRTAKIAEGIIHLRKASELADPNSDQKRIADHNLNLALNLLGR